MVRVHQDPNFFLSRSEELDFWTSAIASLTQSQNVIRGATMVQ